MCCGSLSSLAAQLLESYSNFFLGLHQQSPALRHGYWNFKPFILTHLLERVHMFSLVISKMRKKINRAIQSVSLEQISYFELLLTQ